MTSLNVNIYGVLAKLNDAAFNRVKCKLRDKKDVFIIPRDHPMAAPLLSLLCDDRLFASLDRELVSQIVQVAIPKDILELKWLAKYCDLLLRSLGNVQQNTAKDARASRYADHLVNKMIPEFKKEIQSSSKAARFVESLSFIYKVAACLLRCTAHNEYPFELSVDRGIMEELEKGIYKLPGNIFGAYRNEERAYVLFVSWVLEEILCDQDGIEEEQ